VTVTAGSDLVVRLRDVLADDPTVVVAYLFGSRATGTQRVDSDVDVAVLRPDPSPDGRMLLMAELAAAVAPLDVDLVDLVTAPVDRYLDMAPARRILAEGTRQRLRDGSFGRP
jgi:predicted nucleotidyltransferase